MIVPMKKVSLIVIRELEEQSLAELRDLGVMHVKRDRVASEHGEKLREEYLAVQRTIAALPEVEGDRGDGGTPAPGVRSPVDHALEIAQVVDSIAAEREQLTDERDRLKRELERMAPWGPYDADHLAALSQAGIVVRMIRASKDELQRILGRVPHAFVVRRDRGGISVVSVTLPGEEFPDDIATVPFPERSLGAIEKRIAAIEDRLTVLADQLASHNVHRAMLRRASELLLDSLEFVNVKDHFEEERTLSVLTGFVPDERVDDVKQAASAHGWGVVAREPAPDDPVPTLVRNNAAIRIIQPVFDLLGTIPGYREIDISFFFLLFFIPFFAMIIGDGGYGAILFVGVAISAIRALVAGRGIGIGRVLLMVLSLATVAWGAVTGNWFGYAPLAELPVLRDLVVPELSIDNERSTELIQYACFIIGTVHLSIAHVWNFIREIRQKPRIKALTQVGWLSMVLGLYYVALNLVLGPQYPVPQYAITMIAAGLFAVIVFGQQEEGRSFIVSVGMGAANLITTALDSISAFADIISYIRLFAVGLASLAIAQAFNSMASGVSEAVGGAIGVAVAVPILFFGHTLNLAMGALSVVVHGVRLNMLEFSGHLGMEWTGEQYSPFRNRSLVQQGDM